MPVNEVNVWPPIVMMPGETDCAVGKVELCPLMTSTEAPRERVVPSESVMTPPELRVCPSITYDPEDAVYVLPSTVRADDWVAPAVRGMLEVTPLITTNEPEEARETVVPPVKVRTPPGVNVFPSTT